MASEQFKAQFEADLAANNHELFVFTFSEMGEIIAKHPKGNLPQVRKAWAQIKKPAEVGANYYASADDTLLLAKLIGDLGGFRAQAYIKSHQGKPYIILKGNPGLRNILTGTRYSLHNAKVVSMGLGKVAAQKAIVAGGKLIGLTFLLNTVDEQFGITDKLIAALDELANPVKQHVNAVVTRGERQINQKINGLTDHIFHRVAKAAERIVWRKLDKLARITPRLH